MTNEEIRAIPLAPEWQPIETAPKDGTEILIVAKGYVAIARWKNINTDAHPLMAWAFHHEDDGAYVLHGPSHWQPMPLPPDAAP